MILIWWLSCHTRPQLPQDWGPTLPPCSSQWCYPQDTSLGQGPLFMSDGKRLDGCSILPWKFGEDGDAWTSTHLRMFMRPPERWGPWQRKLSIWRVPSKPPPWRSAITLSLLPWKCLVCLVRQHSASSGTLGNACAKQQGRNAARSTPSKESPLQYRGRMLQQCLGPWGGGRILSGSDWGSTLPPLLLFHLIIHFISYFMSYYSYMIPSCCIYKFYFWSSLSTWAFLSAKRTTVSVFIWNFWTLGLEAGRHCIRTLSIAVDMHHHAKGNSLPFVLLDVAMFNFKSDCIFTSASFSCLHLAIYLSGPKVMKQWDIGAKARQ